jgi:hypothetical protein
MFRSRASGWNAHRKPNGWRWTGLPEATVRFKSWRGPVCRPCDLSNGWRLHRRTDADHHESLPGTRSALENHAGVHRRWTMPSSEMDWQTTISLRVFSSCPRLAAGLNRSLAGLLYGKEGVGRRYFLPTDRSSLKQVYAIVVTSVVIYRRCVVFCGHLDNRHSLCHIF